MQHRSCEIKALRSSKSFPKHKKTQSSIGFFLVHWVRTYFVKSTAALIALTIVACQVLMWTVVPALMSAEAA